MRMISHGFLKQSKRAFTVRFVTWCNTLGEDQDPVPLVRDAPAGDLVLDPAGGPATVADNSQVPLRNAAPIVSLKFSQLRPP